MNGTVVGSRAHSHKFSCPTWSGHGEDNPSRPEGTGPRTRSKGGLCLPSLALQHFQGSHVPFFWRLVLQNQRGELEKAAWNPRSVPRPSTHGSGSWSWQLRDTCLMIQSLVSCVEKSPPPPPNLGFGGKNPFRSNCPIRGRTIPGDSKFPANSAGLPPARLTSPGGEGTLSPRPAETPWACSVWPHLLSSPSLLPPASSNSAASLCGHL